LSRSVGHLPAAANCIFADSSTAFAEFTGLVVSILDGDTMIVLKDGVEEVIRLNGIDCPEKNQVYGDKAKQFTSNKALNNVVTVEVKGVDRDGRTIADVILADGTNLNRELVKEGLAWWFFKYSKDEMLRALEMEARDGKRGGYGEIHFQFHHGCSERSNVSRYLTFPIFNIRAHSHLECLQTRRAMCTAMLNAKITMRC
jgi:endonuclease YncB( thermonuclease family)